MQIYWGDLHNHCGITYGYGSQANALARASDHLDFCAITGHAMWPDIVERNEETSFIVDFHQAGFKKLRDHWDEVRKEIAEANGPDLVTFQAKDEMWENFKYFLDRALPVCEEADIRIALHPNDPPVDCLVGISNLITSAEDYKHAFELAGNSPYLGMKMCIGCWLEGGERFGNVMEDIRYFVENKKVLLVHFRNVSSTIPYFEETLLENGYMDMYELMKQFVRYDYDGMMHVDHVPVWGKSVGGENSSWAYSTGYMKALLNCAKSDLNRSEKK